MENKKWYKRTSTLFWFVLATLPLIVALITTISSSFIHWSDTTADTIITTYLNNNTFTNSFTNTVSWFGNHTPSILNNAFTELFEEFNISNTYATTLGMFFGWFTWTYFIHLIVDIIVWLPKLFHKWLERWE